MARVRSPNYPNISLRDAIDRIRKVHEHEGTNDVDRSSFVEILGYTGITGPSSKLLSSLSKYGLIEKVGAGEVKVSERAMDILFGEEESRIDAISRAANEPSLYAEINTKWPNRQPSDENLKSYLARQGFSLKALENVISAYKETMDYVKAEVGDYGNAIESEDVFEQSLATIDGPHPTSNLDAGKPRRDSGFDIGFDGDSIRISGAIRSADQARKVVSTIQALVSLLPQDVHDASDNEQ